MSAASWLLQIFVQQSFGYHPDVSALPSFGRPWRGFGDGEGMDEMKKNRGYKTDSRNDRSSNVIILLYSSKHEIPPSQTPLKTLLQ